MMHSVIVVQLVICAIVYFLGVFIGRASVKLDMENKKARR